MRNSAGKRPSPGKRSGYFPLLCLNDDQVPSCPVLSADGRDMLPNLPESACLEKYTDKEVWLLTVARLRDGHAAIPDVFTDARSMLGEAKKAMQHFMARESRAREQSALADITDDGLVYPELPSPDRHRVRLDHLVLQLVCTSKHDGNEMGDREITCQSCRKEFALRLPNDDAPDAGKTTSLPVFRIGFADAVVLARGGMVACPHCQGKL